MHSISVFMGVKDLHLLKNIVNHYVTSRNMKGDTILY